MCKLQGDSHAKICGDSIKINVDTGQQWRQATRVATITNYGDLTNNRL